ncbi:MAG: hypothetical protein LUQ01_06280 [Methanolinea sp.]|nr:hypothetical protein [Methanolinea sp.]
MDQKSGKFVKGVWVEEEKEAPPAQTPKEEESMEKRVELVTSQVSASLSQLVGLARDLIATPEGRSHIQKKIDQAGAQIDAAIREALEKEQETGREGGANSGKKEQEKKA